MKITGLKKATHEFNLINKGGYYRRLFSDIWLDRNTGKLWWTEEADRNTYHINDDPACIKLIGHRETDHVTMAEVKAAAQRACDEWNDGEDIIGNTDVIASPDGSYIVRRVTY